MFFRRLPYATLKEVNGTPLMIQYDMIFSSEDGVQLPTWWIHRMNNVIWCMMRPLMIQYIYMIDIKWHTYYISWIICYDMIMWYDNDIGIIVSCMPHWCMKCKPVHCDSREQHRREELSDYVYMFYFCIYIYKSNNIIYIYIYIYI